MHLFQEPLSGFFTDYHLVRQVEFRSRYNVECSLLGDQIIMSAISSVASSNANSLKPVCEQGKSYHNALLYFIPASVVHIGYRHKIGHCL